MKHSLFGEFGRIEMRPLSAEHIEDLRILRNRDDVRTWFFHNDKISQNAQEAWFKQYLEAENDYMFAAFEIEKPENFVGAWAAYHFDNCNKCFEEGRRMIDRTKTQSTGLGYDLLCCGLKIIFSAFDVDIATSRILTANKRSLMLSERLGFREDDRSYSNGLEVVHLYLDRNTFERKIRENEEKNNVNSSLKTKVPY